MPRPIEALIHHDALAHNLAQARQRALGARVWAVVKANAYGHGIERVYEALRGADGFALLDLAEAERVRALGWRGPVLLLEGCFEPRDLELCSRLNLWHTVHHEAQIDWLAAHTYVVAFAGALIDATGLPFPGRLLLVAAGAVTAAQGYPVAVVIVLGAAGAVLTDQLWYFAGRSGGGRW